MIKFITTIPGMNYFIFLVVDNGIAYLVNYDYKTKSFPEDICPCCMYPRHRATIMATGAEVVKRSSMENKVRWCGSDYGDRLVEYKPLLQEYFCCSSASDISESTRQLLHEEALKHKDK